MSTSNKIDALPPLRVMVEQHGLWANKAFGQNYLFDLNLTRKIARTARTFQGTIFEIGPGPGGLTRALLLEMQAKIIAIEKDSRFIAALQPLVEAADGRLQLIESDALQTDLTNLADAPRAVVANLPYNIGTELLIFWLHRYNDFAFFILMFQKEVAQRITAKPGSKDYGRLSILCQALCDTDILFHLPPGAFTPPPKVTSSVVRLVPKDKVELKSIAALEKITASAFGQRRKMLRQSLKPYMALLERAEIDSSHRAEDLSIGQFVMLANFMNETS